MQVQASSTQWISPEEQLHLLELPYEKALLNIFLKSIVPIVLGYAEESLGPNTYNWYNVLKKLKILPKIIPPLPLNIHQILASNCPIFGSPRRFTDTHSLWLIPGGEVADIDSLSELCEEGKTKAFLGIGGVNLKEYEIRKFRTAENVEFKAPTWIVISELLPKSLSAPNYHYQTYLIEELRNKSFANYEVPSFKYALAANLLKRQTEGVGLWKGEEGKYKSTRVEGRYCYYPPGASHNSSGVCTLTIGNVFNPEGNTVTAINSCMTEWRHSSCGADVGIAALWVGFLPKPSKSYCVLL